MRFIAIYRPEKPAVPPTPADMEKMGEFIRGALRAGVLLTTEGFGPSASSDAKIRLSKGHYSMTDGPFAEAKEVIGGFAIMQVGSREEMLDWTRRFLAIAGDGESEVRQLHDVSPIDFFKR